MRWGTRVSVLVGVVCIVLYAHASGTAERAVFSSHNLSTHWADGVMGPFVGRDEVKISSKGLLVLPSE